MVYFKVNDGFEARRFQVTPGEFTFDQLKEKIAVLFPEAAKETTNLVLQYHDSDGDLITLSTEEEFQEVLSELPSDYVWKLRIASRRERKETGQTKPQRQRVSLWDHILEPSWRPFGCRWSSFDRHLRETQELVNLLESLCVSTPEDKKPSTSPTAEDNKQSTPSEDIGEGESQTEGDQTPPDQGESETDSKAANEDGEEVKSKNANVEEEKPSTSDSSSSPSSPKCYLWHLKTYEPFIFGGLFGPTRLVQPVGYHITWSPTVHGGCKSCNVKAAASA